MQGIYEAEVSQRTYQNRRECFIPVGKWTNELAQEVEEKLQQTWSPEQISQRYRTAGNAMVSFKTIYRWLYDGRLARAKISMLRHKGKRRKPLETRGRFLVGKSIKQRPKEIRARETFGHWELDTVVSSRGKSKACVATLIERKTRLYTTIKMPD
ncbi:transposase, IS30 family [Paenibacillus macquariensis]|uniref:Transposase, IS30 family n=1 Tax=Paenibacillus macquariensis TaxID=948756 RepID=A0ABY1KE90_9BACL|nr:transposase, IS30 family [Paenibacillus macquariensis]